MKLFLALLVLLASVWRAEAATFTETAIANARIEIVKNADGVLLVRVAYTTVDADGREIRTPAIVVSNTWDESLRAEAAQCYNALVGAVADAERLPAATPVPAEETPTVTLTPSPSLSLVPTPTPTMTRTPSPSMSVPTLTSPLPSPTL